MYYASSAEPEVRATAKGYKDNLLSYDTVITAKLFVRFFDLSSPLSKYIQTIDVLTAVTSVSCKRSFSWLKKIKDRLRSMLGQENLEAFMFMALEKD